MPSRRSNRCISVFEDLSKLASDTLWKQFYADCSRGIFPAKVRYIDKTRTLFYREKGTKVKSLILSSVININELENITRFFRLEVGIYPNNNSTDGQTSEIPADSVRSEHTRNIDFATSLANIDIFIIELKYFALELSGRNKRIYRKLEQFLMYALLLNMFTYKDVIVEKKKIIGIKNFSYDLNTLEFSFDV